MQTINDIDMAYVPFIIWMFIASVVSFVDDLRSNRLVCAWLTAIATIPIIIAGFMKPAVYGVLPVVFIAVPALLIVAIDIAINKRNQ